MREFYKQVCLDKSSLRFFAECPVCKAKHWGNELPWLCKTAKMPELLENGRAGKLRQRVYNKSLVAAVKTLAKYFNYCCSSGAWVCDDCVGICKNNTGCGNCRGKDTQ